MNYHFTSSCRKGADSSIAIFQDLALCMECLSVSCHEVCRSDNEYVHNSKLGSAKNFTCLSYSC